MPDITVTFSLTQDNITRLVPALEWSLERQQDETIEQLGKRVLEMLLRRLVRAYERSINDPIIPEDFFE